MRAAANAYVVVITQKDARVLALEDAREVALVEVPAGSSRRAHAVQDRHHRPDRPFQYSDAYFAEIARALGSAHRIVLIGHGHGQSDTAAGFKAYLERTRSPLLPLVAAELHADLSARTPRQLVGLARTRLDGDVQTHTSDRLDGVA